VYDFLARLTPRPQYLKGQFSPFYYKDPLVKDCVIELKERNNIYIAKFFSEVLAQYVQKTVAKIVICEPDTYFYFVPIPQHISKTKEKGFLHTKTLAEGILRKVKQRNRNIDFKIFECIKKTQHTKKLHDLKSKRSRFLVIKNTMNCCITKRDAERACFFIIDDVHTTGATFKEARRTLLGSGALPDHLFFISIAH